MPPVDGTRRPAVGGEGFSGDRALIQSRGRVPNTPVSLGLRQSRRSAHRISPFRQPSRAPETVAADAMDEIKSLEAAIALLGEKNVLSQPLLKSLQTRSGQVEGASIAGAYRVMQSVF